MSQISKMGVRVTTSPEAAKPRLRSREAAAYLGISGSTLAKGRMTGNSPPYTKIGRIVVYDRNDIDEWLATRRRRSTSDNSSTAA